MMETKEFRELRKGLKAFFRVNENRIKIIPPKDNNYLPTVYIDEDEIPHEIIYKFYAKVENNKEIQKSFCPHC